jgi:CheY-like chemotaxis protein
MVTRASRLTRKAPSAKAGHVREVVRPEVQSEIPDASPWRSHRAIAPVPDPAPAPVPEPPFEAPHGDGGSAAAARAARLVPPATDGTSPQAAPAPAGPARKPASILVADDERRIRLAIRGCLEAEGYTIYEASDGTEALNQVLLHAPDLLILDLAMPNLDGMRTLRELHALHGQLKPRVVMLTAFGSMPAAASAIGLGAAAFAEKPLVPEALRQLVARVLAEPPDADDHLGIPITWPADPQ